MAVRSKKTGGGAMATNMNMGQEDEGQQGSTSPKSVEEEFLSACATLKRIRYELLLIHIILIAIQAGELVLIISLQHG